MGKYVNNSTILTGWLLLKRIKLADHQGELEPCILSRGHQWDCNDRITDLEKKNGLTRRKTRGLWEKNIRLLYLPEGTETPILSPVFPLCQMLPNGDLKTHQTHYLLASVPAAADSPHHFLKGHSASKPDCTTGDPLNKYTVSEISILIPT